MADHVAVAETEIDASPDRVWHALTDPKEIEKYFFGSRVETDWEPGSSIVWRGEYEGRQYEDHGTILEVKPGHRLMLTHFSPLSGDEDAPENYHTILYEIQQDDGKTHVRLSQDNNATKEQADHSKEAWEAMLSGLKDLVEKG